jgi:hypothetical protein
VDPIDCECHGGHVERCGVSEDLKPGQSHHEINSGEELAKTRHPETPYAHGAIDFGAGFGITEKNLSTPDEVAVPRPKNPIAMGKNGELANVMDSCVIVSELLDELIRAFHAASSATLAELRVPCCASYYFKNSLEHAGALTRHWQIPTPSPRVRRSAPSPGTADSLRD